MVDEINTAFQNSLSDTVTLKDVASADLEKARVTQLQKELQRVKASINQEMEHIAAAY